MAKLLVSLSAANPFLGADRHVNLGPLTTFNDSVKESMKKWEKENGKPVKTEAVYVVKPRVKGVNYSASLEKKKDLKYLAARAFKVAERKRLTEASMGKVKPILFVPPKDVLTAAQQAKMKLAVAAVKAHMKKAESTQGQVKKQKDKNREQNAKVFNKSVEMLQQLLLDGGLKESSMVIGSGMFGTSLIIKLGPDNYVNVGSSDATRFNAARKVAKEATAQ